MSGLEPDETRGKLLDTSEVAEILGIKRNTLYKWRRQGIAPPGFKIGAQVRFRESELRSWISDLESRASE